MGGWPGWRPDAIPGKRRRDAIAATRPTRCSAGHRCKASTHPCQYPGDDWYRGEDETMAMEEKTRRGLHLFSRRTAPFVKDTGAQRPPEMDDAGREAVPELYAGAGTVTKLLYG